MKALLSLLIPLVFACSESPSVVEKTSPCIVQPGIVEDTPSIEEKQLQPVFLPEQDTLVAMQLQHATPPSNVLIGPVFTVLGNSERLVTVPDDSTLVEVGVLVGASDGKPIPEQQVIVIHFGSAGLLKQYDPRQTFWVPLTQKTDTLVVHNFTDRPLLFSITWKRK